MNQAQVIKYATANVDAASAATSLEKNTTGIGLRLEFLGELAAYDKQAVDVLEIAPENWLNVGGARRAYLDKIKSHTPLIAHGLSLSLGSLAPLNMDFLAQIKSFLKENHIKQYSEHLSYCCDEQGYLYELLPILFSSDAVKHVAKRIRLVQDYLEQKIAVENISYYYNPQSELTELEFINAVLEEADCDLLLDVNNVYVNSINHHYDAWDFISQLPIKRVAYTHVAGHHQSKDIIIDDHGHAISKPVWQLLAKLYQHYGALPTILERDNAIPALSELLLEQQAIQKLMEQSHALV